MTSYPCVVVLRENDMGNPHFGQQDKREVPHCVPHQAWRRANDNEIVKVREMRGPSRKDLQSEATDYDEEKEWFAKSTLLQKDKWFSTVESKEYFVIQT